MSPACAAITERLDHLDQEVRLIVARWWRAHGLPRVEELDVDQARLVDEYLAWWEPAAPMTSAELLPPPDDRPRVEVPPMHPLAVVHSCQVPYVMPRGRVRYLDYQRELPPGVACVECGWSADLPMPGIADVEARVRRVFGRFALSWGRALVRRLELPEAA
jgi:hypothetical protein